MTKAEAIREARKLRAKIRLEEEAAILASPQRVKKAIQSAVRTGAARRYSEISEELGIEIVWGKGGAQNDRVRKLKRKGVDFIEVD